MTCRSLSITRKPCFIPASPLAACLLASALPGATLACPWRCVKRDAASVPENSLLHKALQTRHNQRTRNASPGILRGLFNYAEVCTMDEPKPMDPADAGRFYDALRSVGLSAAALAHGEAYIGQECLLTPEEIADLARRAGITAGGSVLDI